MNSIKSGNSLKIRSARCVLHHQTITITIPVRIIESLTLNGSGNFSSKNKLKGADLDLDLNGSGDINLLVEAEKFGGTYQWFRDILLKGSARTNEYR